MSQKRKLMLACFQVVVEHYDDGSYEVLCEDLSWTVARATDGHVEIIDAPTADERPPRLTDEVILAAVRKFHVRYRYSC